MARAYFPERLRHVTDGLAELEVAAASYRELLLALEQRFPGFQATLGTGVAVAIDGDIIHDPLVEPLRPDAEVHFLHRLGGG